MLLLWIIIALFLAYVFFMVWCRISWDAIPYPIETGSSVSGPKLTVIIPARNESKRIGTLLEALAKQRYPRDCWECIVVDDQSEDDSAAIVARFPEVQYILLPFDKKGPFGKKAAITLGINAARNEWIVCTDADCVPGPGWLENLAAEIQRSNPVFIVAPVHIPSGPSLVQRFQSIDFMVMQGITGSVVHRNLLTMCNGANLAYRKDAFMEADGFRGVDHLASGDDMLLMYKIWKRYPQKVSYLRSQEAIVSTAAAESWPDFFRQRIRWASKARAYQDKRILPVLLLVYLLNLSFPVLLIAGFFYPAYWWYGLALLLLKWLAELPLALALGRFFRVKHLWFWLLLLQPLHIAYVLVSGWLGQWGTYTWKGRRVR